MVFGFGVWDFVGLERFESSVGFRVYSVKGLGLQWFKVSGCQVVGRLQHPTCRVSWGTQG